MKIIFILSWCSCFVSAWVWGEPATRPSSPAWYGSHCPGLASKGRLRDWGTWGHESLLTLPGPLTSSSGSGWLSGAGWATPLLWDPCCLPPSLFLQTLPAWNCPHCPPAPSCVCVSRHQDKCSYKQCGGLGANLSDAVHGCDSEYINIFT